jgi:hypothetical protein
MLSIPYTTLVLAAGIGSLAAAANAAESYDLTNCAASTVTTVSATEELTVISLDNKGIARSNSANKAFDNATFECAYVVSVAGAQRSGLGYCKFMAPDGDFFVGEAVPDSTGGRKMEVLAGCRKVEGYHGRRRICPADEWKADCCRDGAGLCQGDRYVRTLK